MAFDKLTLDLVKWVGIDPRTSTLGGMGYQTVAELFINNTSLTKKDTYMFQTSVKDRFCYFFEKLNSTQKAKIIQETLKIYQPNPLFPMRTTDLWKTLLLAQENLLKSVQQLEVEKHLSVLKMEKLTTSDDLKAHYIQAIKKYHPDKVNDLGEEIKEMALLKTKEINAAFEYLKSCLFD